MCIHDWVLQIPKDQPRTKSLHPVVATATATNSLSPRGSHAPDEDYSVDGKEDNVAEGHHEAVHEDLGYHDADATLLRLLHCTQSINSIKLNVAAVVDLWESQRSLGINNYDTPRDKNSTPTYELSRRWRMREKSSGMSIAISMVLQPRGI
ncbi:hypothetical protein, variant [Cryptococcus amylolentus CBS 6039]|nr:hypothetical protein, variant [Cryptococcus amylolentus CBS 6039]ODN76241.1 hypothetical protein, variant [Cryptococcus amylolentus CBS 6039]